MNDQTTGSVSHANVQHIDSGRPGRAANLEKFHFGTSLNPSGEELAVDGVSLLRDGKRFIPVMGEFHYARYPHEEWRDELLKMKAGGISVVASYIFWIHHEETLGQWDFAGDRDLRAFVHLCAELGLLFVARCGPWDHGEVRNGGLPEWLLDQQLALRTDDPAYLAHVRRLFDAIAEQLTGMLWKDGGPVIAVQIENEYGGPAEHLLTLKALAIAAGLDVPLYTRTGWPELQTPMPFGQLLPLYGGYSEGFWDRELTSMPGRYWQEFVFKHVRTDTAIANEQFGDRTAEDDADTAAYPYLTCELGPGMMCSYHRRITYVPMDALAMLIVKLGSGSNLPGYYVFHGGTNPIGREPWLQENQRTRFTNYNDLPVKSYDFQTALGEFGQLRPQYHLLRPVHLFLQEFGERLATLHAALPTTLAGTNGATQLRWSFRTDGCCGFVFVNNYQRLLPQPPRPDVQLRLKLDDGDLVFPAIPTTIAADRAFFWPVRFDLGDGITLSHATAQPVCQVRDGDAIYTVFTTTGNPAEFAFAGQARAATENGVVESPHFLVQNATPGTTPILTLTAGNGAVHRVILLDEAATATLYQSAVAGQQRLVLTPAGVVFDGAEVRLATETDADSQSVLFLPKPDTVLCNGEALIGVADGAFTRYALPVVRGRTLTARVELIRIAGPRPKIEIGMAGVAMQPTDADFKHAAVWHISLPADVDPARSILLRLHYTGDVARAYLGDTLLTDNFYNGTPFEIGLNRFGPRASRAGITVKILPLPADAPIFMLDSVRPSFAGDGPVVSLDRVELVESAIMRLDIR